MSRPIPPARIRFYKDVTAPRCGGRLRGGARRPRGQEPGRQNRSSCRPWASPRRSPPSGRPRARPSTGKGMIMTRLSHRHRPHAGGPRADGSGSGALRLGRPALLPGANSRPRWSSAKRRNGTLAGLGRPGAGCPSGDRFGHPAPGRSPPPRWPPSERLAGELDDMALTGLLHAAGLYGSAVRLRRQRRVLDGEGGSSCRGSTNASRSNAGARTRRPRRGSPPTAPTRSCWRRGSRGSVI